MTQKKALKKLRELFPNSSVAADKSLMYYRYEGIKKESQIWVDQESRIWAGDNFKECFKQLQEYLTVKENKGNV